MSKYGSADDLTIKEVETPSPKDDEVLVKVKATSVNDWDWGLLTGKPFIIRLLIGLFKPKKVTIPGVDIAGEVVSKGCRVTHYNIGDRVYGDLSENNFGGFAEFVAVPATSLTPIPNNMSYEQAAALPHAAMLAVQGLRDVGGVQPGQEVLINGAGGGVGTIGVQIAKAIGVKTITGVDSEDKFPVMASIGFDHILDYKTQSFIQQGKEYDLILDNKMSCSVFSAIRVLKTNGNYVVVGGSLLCMLLLVCTSFFIRIFCRKHVHILKLTANKDMRLVGDLFDAEKLKPVIDGPYPFDDAIKAIEHFGKAKHVGKVVITLN